MEDTPISQGRRHHSAALKADVVSACARPGASVAGVALAHGLNTNLVHRWRRQSEGRVRTQLLPKQISEFVSVPIRPAAESAPAGEIHIALRRGSLAVEVQWPLAGASACTQWLREILR